MADIMPLSQSALRSDCGVEITPVAYGTSHISVQSFVSLRYLEL